MVNDRFGAELPITWFDPLVRIEPTDAVDADLPLLPERQPTQFGLRQR